MPEITYLCNLIIYNIMCISVLYHYLQPHTDNSKKHTERAQTKNKTSALNVKTQSFNVHSSLLAAYIVL